MARKSRSGAKTKSYGNTKIDDNLLIILAGFVAIVLLLIVATKMFGVDIGGLR